MHTASRMTAVSALAAVWFVLAAGSAAATTVAARATNGGDSDSDSASVRFVR
jgi:hypothetical protein